MNQVQAQQVTQRDKDGDVEITPAQTAGAPIKVVGKTREESASRIDFYEQGEEKSGAAGAAEPEKAEDPVKEV